MLWYNSAPCTLDCTRRGCQLRKVWAYSEPYLIRHRLTCACCLWGRAPSCGLTRSCLPPHRHNLWGAAVLGHFHNPRLWQICRCYHSARAARCRLCLGGFATCPVAGRLWAKDR